MTRQHKTTILRGDLPGGYLLTRDEMATGQVITCDAAHISPEMAKAIAELVDHLVEERVYAHLRAVS